MIIAVAILAVAGIVFALTYCDHEWLDATCTDPVTCARCGKTKGEALGHTWSDATCTDPEICSVCGEIQGTALGHTWQDATCTDPEICSVCGETQGKALGHTWQDATCSAPKTCAVCGETRGKTLPHTWQDATCTVPKTCSVCGATEGDLLEHTWIPATCLTLKTCSVCGTTEGELADHAWAAATCLAPKTCTVCGKTEGTITDHSWKNPTCTAPKTCAVCGKTEGEALGHTWTAATCETPQTCTVCGATNGNALGHSFTASGDGKTKTCGTCGKTVTIKYVAITFDDGPSGDITRNLLSGLSQRGVRATFFLCGYRMETYGSLPQTIMDYGHEIGLHGYSHNSLSGMSADGVRQELAATKAMLPEGCNVALMRPPGGAYNSTVKQVCAEMGLSVILWSVDPQDWATSDVGTITSRIVNNAKAGSIILMHDLKSSSVQAALNAIDILRAQGYEFVTVSRLAQIQGVSLQPGGAYSSLG